MPLYAIDGKKCLRLISEQPVRFEADIQGLVEANLDVIFGLKLVAHEFTVEGFTLDTVGFDEETKAFVIIEYKRDAGGSVIDQGWAYLSTMLNHRADFVLKYHEAVDRKLTRDQVDWSQSRVLFLTQRYTPYQVAAINFKDLPIELWRFSRFENGTLLLEQIKPTATTASIRPLMRGREARTVQATVEVRSVGDYAESLPKSLRELFETLEAAVKNELPDVSLKVGKGRLLMLKRRWATACYLRPQQKALRLLARLPSVPDGNGLGTMRRVQPDDVFKVQAHLRASKDIRPALELIKAAYQETARSLGEKG